jgi:hypothetical protein
MPRRWVRCIGDDIAAVQNHLFRFVGGSPAEDFRVVMAASSTCLNRHILPRRAWIYYMHAIVTGPVVPDDE